MSSLKDSIALLESDLKAIPPRINVYHDLPFAIMRYDPSDEWELRREIKLLATRLESVGRQVHSIPMSNLLWSALEKIHQMDDDESREARLSVPIHNRRSPRMPIILAAVGELRGRVASMGSGSSTTGAGPVVGSTVRAPRGRGRTWQRFSLRRHRIRVLDKGGTSLCQSTPV